MRDEFANCPRCAAGLDEKGTRLVCTRCEGSLVPEHDVSVLIADIETVNLGEPTAPTDIPLEPQLAASKSELVLTCPRCMTQMTKHSLHGLTVDRCLQHGIWFDGEELQAALAAAGISAVETKRKAPTGNKVAFGLSMAALIALNVIRFIYF